MIRGIVVGNRANWRAELVTEQADTMAATLDALSVLLPLDDSE